MSKSVAILFFFISIIFSSCEDKININEASLDEAFWLEEKSSVIIIIPADEEQDELSFEVHLDSINDSRCPADAICLSAGNAILKLTTGHSEHKLCMDDCRNTGLSDSVSFANKGRHYYIKLLDIQPYPMQANKGKTKSAQLNISTTKP